MELREQFCKEKRKGECEGQRHAPTFKSKHSGNYIGNHAQIHFLLKTYVYYSQTIEVPTVSGIAPGKGETILKKYIYLSLSNSGNF